MDVDLTCLRYILYTHFKIRSFITDPSGAGDSITGNGVFVAFHLD